MINAVIVEMESGAKVAAQMDGFATQELAKRHSDCLLRFIAVAGVLLATTHDILPRSSWDKGGTRATVVPSR
jgi:hypothetical protein